VAESPWFTPPPARPGNTIIVGGGLAGCSAAHALDQLGVRVTLLEQQTIASAGSGNKRAVLRPHRLRCDNIFNDFNHTAFTACSEVLRALLTTSPALEHKLCGVVQLLDNITGWPEFQGSIPVSADAIPELGGLTNVEIDGRPVAGALVSAGGGWVNLPSFCQALLTQTHHVQVKDNHSVLALEPTRTGWRVHTNVVNQLHTLEADNVIVAGGTKTLSLLPDYNLPLMISSGQTTRCVAGQFDSHRVITGRRYVIPEDGVCTLGATHHRLDESLVANVADDLDNIARVNQMLPSLQQQWPIIDHWRALRASSPDRMPIAGAMPDLARYKLDYAALKHGPQHQQWPAATYVPGLYLLAGLGSRGLVNCTLTARVLSAIISGTLTEQDRQFADLIHPARFAVRALRRQRF